MLLDESLGFVGPRACNSKNPTNQIDESSSYLSSWSGTTTLRTCLGLAGYFMLTFWANDQRHRLCARSYFCFATILYLIPSYVARGRIFF